ncbi:hypothetical protein [Streptomyces sp. NPDC091278]|uniref:hypothetical protein n=1 Tax=Streptomyces sp. NPDC091278 TaxID=3155301 RepID=UPI00344C1449
MNRTSVSKERRRHLADAASGFPERTRVILYACLPETVDPAPVIARLREYADARDFVVPEGGVLIDTDPKGTARRERAGWFTVSTLLRDGAVEGIVAPSQAHIEGARGDYAEFTAWLTTYGKFVCYLEERCENAVAADGSAASA